MSDLTLYEFSELNEEEIKTRLLEDYNTICCRTDTLNEMGGRKITPLKDMKPFFNNIRMHITAHLKSIFSKIKPSLKTVRNNP